MTTYKKYYKYIFYFILIIFIINIISYVNIYENYKTCDFGHVYLTKNQLNDLKDLLLNFIYFANKNDVKYFAISGTLIGCIRNGGLIPYDDDIDLGILKEDTYKINHYKNDKDTYYFEDVPFGYKFKKKNSEMFIDLMVYELDKSDNTYKIINGHFKNEYFKNDEINNLILKTYNGIELYVPNEYEKHMNRANPNWNTKLKINEPHLKSESINEKLKDLPKEFDIKHENSKYMCYSDF